MKPSPPDIQALQTRLQAIQSRRGQPRPPLPSASLPPDLKATYSPPTAASLSYSLLRKNPDEGWVGQGQGQPPYPAGEDPAALVESLQQRSLDCIRKLQNLPAQPLLALPEAPPAASPQTIARTGQQQLEAQAQRVNQLAVAQEAALKELKAIAQQLEQDQAESRPSRRGSRSRNRTQQNPSPMLNCLEVAVPHLEPDANGGWVLTSRSIDWAEAEREAAWMAEQLRQQSSQQNRQQPSHQASHQASHQVSHQAKASQQASQQPSHQASHQASHQVSQQASQPRHRRRDRADSGWGVLGRSGVKQVVMSLGHAANPAVPRDRRKVSSRIRRSQATSTPFSMQAGLLWIGGAVVMRVVLDAVLVAYPGFWLPVMGLIIAPAAIALYQSTVHPQTSFVWGCRLFLILFGLLLGGRL